MIYSVRERSSIIGYTMYICIIIIRIIELLRYEIVCEYRGVVM